MEIGLSIGANLGDRLKQMTEAKKMILDLPGIRQVAQSPVYETEPVEVPPEFQHLPFLNAILIIETLLSSHQIMNMLRFIEQKVGRVPDPVPNAPRHADIDIIYAGDLQINDEQIIIPHPRWSIRRFVLQPLSDVRPDLRIPGQNGTVSEVLTSLSDEAQVTWFAKNW